MGKNKIIGSMLLPFCFYSCHNECGLLWWIQIFGLQFIYNNNHFKLAKFNKPMFKFTYLSISQWTAGIFNKRYRHFRFKV